MKNEEYIDSLFTLLENKDEKVSTQARKSLEAIGKPAVERLCDVLLKSKVYKEHWHAAKALVSIACPSSIPSLVLALDDHHFEIGWMAALTLIKFKMAAWPELLIALVNHGADSVRLRNAAHHVLVKQHANGFDELLNTLLKSLETGAVAESTPIAAAKVLMRLREE